MKSSVQLLIGILCSSLLLLFSESAWAQKKAIDAEKVTLIIPWKTGDSFGVARQFVPIFSKHLGVPVELQSVQGGFGQSALDLVHAAKPDGKTLMFGGTTDLGFRLIGDPDAPVRWDEMDLLDIVMFQSMGCVMSPGSRYKNIHQVVAAIKSKQHNIQILSYSRFGILFTAYMLRQFGLSLNDLTFVKVERPQTIDQAMRERPDRMTCVAVNSLIETFNKPEYIPLISNSVQVIKEMPGLLVARQTGVKSLENFHYWNMILGPKGIPKAERQKIRNAMAKVQNDPEWQRYLAANYAIPTANKNIDMKKFLVEESMFYEKVAILSHWITE